MADSIPLRTDLHILTHTTTESARHIRKHSDSAEDMLILHAYRMLRRNLHSHTCSNSPGLLQKHARVLQMFHHMQQDHHIERLVGLRQVSTVEDLRGKAFAIR